MKKFTIAVFFAAVAAVGAAAAAPSYVYSALISRYADKDANPGATHAGWYSVYCLTQSAARQTMGTDSAVTYETYAGWLGQDFAANRDATAAVGQGAPAFESYYAATGQYFFYDNTLDYGSDLADSLVVCFYAHGGDFGYTVIAQDGDEPNVFSADDRAQASSGWLAASVPEPTGGLLLLLGSALLALRRKRG